MAVIAYRTAQMPVWKPRGFSQQDIRLFGDTAVGLMVNRIQRGVNVFDLPAKPLSKAYAKQKTRRGRPAVRDWTLSGDTLAAMGVVELKDGSVALGIDWRSNPQAFKIALFNQTIERMAGLSPSDKQKLWDLIESTYRLKAAA